jgi:hypothetical protein
LNPAGALALKLVLTPVLIGAASLAGRRWGSAVGGWLIGIPFTSAPIAFFLALDPGPAFAAKASEAIIAGAISQAAFCVVYAWSARNAGWPLSLVAAGAGFALSTIALTYFSVAAGGTFAIVLVALVVALFVMPDAARTAGARVQFPAWDLPARMIVATAFVVLLTEVAPLLGPRLSGLLAPFPLYGAVLASFARTVEGPDASIQVVRGLVLGLFAFASFFLVLSSLLERNIALAFVAAIAVTLVVQSAALVAGRRLGIA